MNMFTALANLKKNNLAAWHDFEVAHPDTFKGMYQFWCQKKRG